MSGSFNKIIRDRIKTQVVYGDCCQVDKVSVSERSGRLLCHFLSELRHCDMFILNVITVLSQLLTVYETMLLEKSV